MSSREQFQGALYQFLNNGEGSLYESVCGVPLISSVMIEACDEKKPRTLVALLKAGLPPDILLCKENRVTLLMRASYSDPGTVRLLLRSGASPNLQDSRGWTALMYSVALDQTSCSFEDSCAIVSLLLSYGADKEIVNAEHHSVTDILMMQCYYGSDEISRIAALLQGLS